jgi:hypothetical protein
MEARITRVVSITALLLACCFASAEREATAAGYKTANFTVSAPTPQLAKEIGDQAEVYRKQLAIEWLGQELPQWSKSCPIRADVAPNKGAGGQTSFVFDRGEVYGWNMSIQGSRERILDSVLPHEVTHTIFASYFRQPLPRWADEGACTTVEHRSEIAKQERNLVQYLKTGRGIPFGQMFAMKEYPHDVMPLYAQGHALSDWLIQSHGKKAFLAFLSDGMADENWPRAVKAHYGFDSLLAMQTSWNNWVKQGRPQLVSVATPAGQVASKSSSSTTPTYVATAQPNVRLQSPDHLTPVTPVTPVAGAAAKPTPGTAAVTVATPGSSVYVVSASKSEAGPPLPAPVPPAAMASAASVYDASRGSAPIRR